MMKAIMNAINFYKINPQNKDDLLNLYDTLKTIQYPFLKSLYPDKIINYIVYLTNENSLKDKIVCDGFIYYLVVKNNVTIGYFSCKMTEDSLLIYEIRFMEDKKEETLYENIMDFLKQKTKKFALKKITAYVQKNDNYTNDIFKKLHFKLKDFQARYIGCDIYLFENVFEYII